MSLPASYRRLHRYLFSPQVMHIQYLHPHTHTLSLLIQAAQNTLMAKLQAKA